MQSWHRRSALVALLLSALTGCRSWPPMTGSERPTLSDRPAGRAASQDSAGTATGGSHPEDLWGQGQPGGELPGEKQWSDAHRVPDPASPGPSPGPWPLELAEALRTALTSSDVLRKQTAGILSIDPATRFEQSVEQANALQALAAYDVAFDSDFSWRKLLSPPNAFFGPGLTQPERRDVGTLKGGFAKRGFLGTQGRLDYSPDPGYLFLPQDTSIAFNPSHSANVALAVQQPLLRGLNSTANRAPITLAELRAEQAATDYELAMLQFFRGVEENYWQLHAALEARKVIETQLPQLEEVVRLQEASLKASRATPAEVAKARAQFHNLRQQLMRIQGDVLARQMQLKTLIGVPPSDPRTIIPVTRPGVAPLIFDRDASVTAATTLYPTVRRQQLSVQTRELELFVARRALLPQLDVRALYRMNGLDDRLDQAISQMFSQDFHDWEFGAAFSMPLGRRAAKAGERAAAFRVQRERAVLEQEQKLAAHRVLDAIREIDALQAQYRESEQRRIEAQKWLAVAKVRHQSPPPRDVGANWLFVTLDDYLNALRTVADATTESAGLVARYNTALVRLEEFQGTLLTSREAWLLGCPDDEPSPPSAESPPGKNKDPRDEKRSDDKKKDDAEDNDTKGKDEKQPNESADRDLKKDGPRLSKPEELPPGSKDKTTALPPADPVDYWSAVQAQHAQQQVRQAGRPPVHVRRLPAPSGGGIRR